MSADLETSGFLFLDDICDHLDSSGDFTELLGDETTLAETHPASSTAGGGLSDELCSHPLFLSIVEKLARLSGRTVELPPAILSLESDSFGQDPTLTSLLSSIDSELSEAIVFLEETLEDARQDLAEARYRPSRRKRMLTDEQTRLLKRFFVNEESRPSSEQKALLCAQTGVSLATLNQWFVNARRRLGYLKSSKSSSDDEDQRKS